MRGCLRRVAKDKTGLPKGEHTWDIILALGRGPNGKHQQKWVRFHGTGKQAQQKLTELVGEVHRGEFVEPSKVTLDAWLDDWLSKAIKPPRCTLNTLEAVYDIIAKHLKPSLGHVPLQQLTHLQVERYYAERKLAPRSVAIHHAILSSALNAAMTGGLLRRNVAKSW